MSDQSHADTCDDDGLVVTDDELLVEPAEPPEWAQRVGDQRQSSSDRVGAVAKEALVARKHGRTDPEYLRQARVGLQHPDFDLRLEAKEPPPSPNSPTSRTGGGQRRRVRGSSESTTDVGHAQENEGRYSQGTSESVIHRSERPNVERKLLRRDFMREGDVLLGKYRVERFATESLVTTAEATHLEMGNRVQVLLLSSKCRGFVAARDHFMRVSRVLNRMQSRHVARILDAGTLDGSIPFTVSQLVGATHLGALIREQGPLSISDAVDFILQLSEGLAEAHSYGILHGSLKPANVRLISGIDGSPSVSLLGFGVPGQWTLSEGQGLPTSGRGERWPASSLPYLAPEQIRHPMDLVCRSDIWALGTILHEALAGEPPFRSDNAASLLASIVADPAAPLSNWRSDVPRSLDSVVNHCLEKDPNARFASVAEMSRALQPFASPDTQNLVERIARVVARQGRASLSVSRSSKAVIHLRGEEAHTSRDRRPKSEPSGTTYAAHRAVRPQPRSNWLLMMGALLGVGVASGVGGAVVAAKLVAPKPALAQDAAAPSLASAVQIYAAMPTAASSGAAGPPKEAGSVPVAAPVPPERAVAARVHRNRDVMGKTKVEPQRPESVEPDTVMAEPSSRPIVASGQLFDDIQ